MPSKQFENSVSEHEVFETPNGSDIKDIQLGSVATRSDAFNIQFDPRFQAHYENTLCYDLIEKLCLNNSHETPKIEKIILNASVSFKPQQVRGLATTSASTSGIPKSKTLANAGKKKNSGKSRVSGMLPNFGHGLED